MPGYCGSTGSDKDAAMVVVMAAEVVESDTDNSTLVSSVVLRWWCKYLII